MQRAPHAHIPRTLIQLASPAPAGEVALPQAVTEEALSSCLPRPCGEGGTRSVTDGVFTSFSGCHHSPQSGAVVLFHPPKHTTTRPPREWSHPDTSIPLPSPRRVAGETSPAQAESTIFKINRKQQGESR